MKMEQKNSKMLNDKIVQTVSAYCSANNIENVDDFVYKCFKQGFDIEKYGFLGKTLNEGEKDLKTGGIEEKQVIKEVIVEKRVEVPVEVIKEVEKLVEVPVEVIKEIPVEKIVIQDHLLDTPTWHIQLVRGGDTFVVIASYFHLNTSALRHLLKP